MLTNRLARHAIKTRSRRESSARIFASKLSRPNTSPISQNSSPTAFTINDEVLDNVHVGLSGIKQPSMAAYLSNTPLANTRGATVEMREKQAIKDRWNAQNLPVRKVYNRIPIPERKIPLKTAENLPLTQSKPVTSSFSSFISSNLSHKSIASSNKYSHGFTKGSYSQSPVLSSLSNRVQDSIVSPPTFTLPTNTATNSILGRYNQKPSEQPSLNNPQRVSKEPSALKPKSPFSIRDKSNEFSSADTSLKSILDKNLGGPHIPWRQPSKLSAISEIAAGAAPSEDESIMSEVTEGEKRHLQYQKRIEINKKEFNSKMPMNDEVKAYTKNAESTPPPAPAVMSVSDLRKQLAADLAAQFKSSKATAPSTTTPSLNSTVKTNTATSQPAQRVTVIKEIFIPSSGLTLREIASKCSLKLSDVREKLADLGESFIDTESEERLLDADLIELLALELGIEAKRGEVSRDADAARPSIKEGQAITSRNPVVCVMGHVDHGKTTLLDTLRKASVAATEAGGITQKLSAFSVDIKDRQVIFLDTPGHAAFTAMRSHGAAATDIVILVVAADDGVQPQTKEGIKIAKDAGCSIVVALNKIDKFPQGSQREAARLRILTELLEQDLVAESFGGDLQVIEVSGKSGEGLDALMEGVLLQADILDLKAAATGMAECTVLEASMEKGRGVVCDLVVSWGELSVGDNVVVGTSYGKVKAMTNDKGKAITRASPSMPVRLVGLRTVPSAGQELISVSSEAKARQIVERREKVIELRKLKMQVSEASSGEASGGPIEVNVVLKADGHGTLNALQKLVQGMQSRTSDVAIKVISSGVGDITRTEVENASSMQNAFMLGFNIGMTDSVARELAKQLDIKIFRDTIIYRSFVISTISSLTIFNIHESRLEDSLLESMQALMPKEKHFELEGKARILQLFSIKGKQQSSAPFVAGVSVSSGLIKTSKPGKAEYIFRVYRGGVLLADNVIGGELKRYKDLVHEVAQGNECGLSFDTFKDLEVDDEIECHKVEWKSKQLTMRPNDSSSASMFEPLAATG